MSARDELALILVNAQRARYTLPPRTTTEHCSASSWAEADEILAAGYRKPRTITTAEELEALPFGSVILDPAGLSLHKNEFTGWRASNGAKDIPVDMLEREALPATVLHEPGASCVTG